MNRKPNDGIIINIDKKKRNHIEKRFKDIFDILFDADYYEGTNFGKFFNKLNADNKSTIYIKDPLEGELKEIITSKKNISKYLIGFTGMGKTTLLRNFFGVFDRDIKIENKNLIVYISFYYAQLSSDRPQSSVEDEVIRYFSRAINLLKEKNNQIDFNSQSFWSGFYDFVEKNKPVLLQVDEIVPEFFEYAKNRPLENEINEKVKKIRKMQETSRLEYYSSLLKYVLQKNESIDSVVFVFDDIESKEAVFHRPIIEVVRHLQSCFSANILEHISIKTIISLRAYTFRSNIDRQLEARREFVQNNAFLKREVVDLHKIIEKRFEEIEKMKDITDNSSFKQAKEQFFLVENNIQNRFGDFILQLVNYNLCHAMILCHAILTNVRWISGNESETEGSFVVDAKDYRLTTELVFRAIACKENEAYINGKNQFFPNLLYNQKENTELLGLYIIRYMKNKKADDLYGETYIEGDVIVRDILDIFVSRGDAQVKRDVWQSKLFYMIEYLYNSGILLRSIYDIESIDERQIERNYKGDYKLYVSPRGQCLYNQLSQNALLLELYRDDIITDLPNNDKITSQLSKKEVFIYIIKYLDVLFQYEKGYIGNAGSVLRQYVDYFGTELIVSPLVEGVVKNINSYYSEAGDDYLELMEQLDCLLKSINAYIREIEKEYGISFRITSYLLDR